MAEKNLGALKREPIKTEHLGLQEQLDRVRDFTNAVMAQEKLIDDLKVQGALLRSYALTLSCSYVGLVTSCICSLLLCTELLMLMCILLCKTI